MPKTLELEEIHFFEGAFRGPILKGNAVRRQEYSGAVIAKPAMDIDRFPRLLLTGRRIRQVLHPWEATSRWPEC